jgi:hypothetical protein
MENLTHIVPRLPPTVGGVGDYCVKLWEHWPEPQPHWSFLITEGAMKSQAQWPQVIIVDFEKSITGLITTLETVGAKTVLLHYVSYGFHPKGCPVWLPSALKQWKALGSDRQIVIMFHELYATGPIWTSSFWVKPIAHKILRDLIISADFWLTSCSRYYSELVNLFAADSQKGILIPIGAGILPIEPVSFDRPWPLFIGKQLKVVIFGLAKTRLWALDAHRELLRVLCEQGWVESITLAGSSKLDAKSSKKLAAHRNYIGHNDLWQEAFDLHASEISGLLMSQDLGLVNNKFDVLTKSTVFAALSAHGVLPVICDRKDTKSGNLGKSIFQYDGSFKSISAFLEEIQNEKEIYQKKRALQKLNQTYLDWKTITLAWSNHLKKSLN